MTRHRSVRPAATFVLVSTSLLASVAAPPASAAAERCNTVRGKTVLLGDQFRVIKKQVRNARRTPMLVANRKSAFTGDLYVSCKRPAGLTHVIGDSGTFKRSGYTYGDSTFTATQARGRYFIGNQSLSRGSEEEYDLHIDDVYSVVDAITGRISTYYDSSASIGGDVGLPELLLNRLDAKTGNVAYITAGDVDDGDGHWVYAQRFGSVSAQPLDASEKEADLPLRSLRINGATVRWTKKGTAKSAEIK